MPSQNFQWLPVEALGPGRGEAQSPGAGSRQGGAQRSSESEKVLREENAAVGARAAS